MLPEILPATDATIADVEAWLDAEEAMYQTAMGIWEAEGWGSERPPRGFRCNWDSTKERWRKGEARVDILLVDGKAVGFLNGTDILEVKPEVRGKGYGRLLAEFMIKVAYEEGRSVVEIEIAPSTAEPFWKRMGFTMVPDRTSNGGGAFAYRVLKRHYRLGDGQRIPFTIQFYTERGRYAGNPTAFSSFSGFGESLGDGSVQLPERAFCFEPDSEQDGDYFVSIDLGGDVIHFDKTKYELSKAHGVRQDAGYHYYVDRIIPHA